jgi:microcystin-dependent protein
MTLFNFVPSGTILPFGGVTAPAGWLLCDGSAISRTTYANLYSAIGVVWGSGDGSITFHLPDLRGRFLRGRDGGAARDPDRTLRTAANTGGNIGDNVGSVQDNATAKNGLSATAGTSSLSALTMNSSSLTLSLNGVSANHNHGTGDAGAHGHFVAKGNFGGDDFNLFDGTGAERLQMADQPTDDIDIRADDVGNHNHGNTGNQSADHSHTLNSGSAAAQTLVSSTVAAQGITVGNGDNETRPKNANVNYIIKI